MSKLQRFYRLPEKRPYFQENQKLHNFGYGLGHRMFYPSFDLIQCSSPLKNKANMSHCLEK